MTDEQIAEQILVACRDSRKRYDQTRKAGIPNTKAALAEFLSGMNLAANFLVRADGSVTPQQLERALLIAGTTFGFKLDQA